MNILKLYRTFISIFLLGLSSLAFIPAELIHSLYGHEDTIDHFEIYHCTSIEREHHHCLILKIEAREYIPLSISTFSYPKLIPEILSFYYCNSYISLVYLHNEQRGPPIVFSV